MVNLRLNQFGNNVFHVNKAISYCHEPGTKAPFVVGMKNTEGRLGRAEDDGEEMLVECVRLSDIIAEHIQHDFSLVCDIEGSEVELLYREPEALNRCRFAIMELHKSVLNGKVIQVDETLRRITSELGFKLIDRNGPVVCLAK